ncbi:hypothetical protein [Massilia sp.]|uniref:hypothetical protein n=1 Tax=Massilia sp. TaxID=1882437 RepID=UPI00352C1F9D
MMRSLLAFAVVTFSVTASAQMSPDSPMVLALRDGRASTALPESQGAHLVAQRIQRQTGSQDAVTIEYVRITRFVSQPRCGRVGYTLYQKSSNTYWAQFGGQLNICDDGAPPLRACKGSAELVRADSQCADGSFPVDTPEITASIAKAVAGGSMTGEQFKARFAPKPKKDGGTK